MTDLNNRPIEAEIDFDSEGNAYYASGVYLDTGESVADEVLEYLTEIYPEDLEDAEYERPLIASEEMYDYFGSRS